MKIKEKSDIEDVIFPLDTIEQSEDTEEISHMTSTSPTSSVSIKTELSCKNKIIELDFLLMEFPDTRFHRKKRKEIESPLKGAYKSTVIREKREIKISKAGS